MDSLRDYLPGINGRLLQSQVSTRLWINAELKSFQETPVPPLNFDLKAMKPHEKTSQIESFEGLPRMETIKSRREASEGDSIATEESKSLKPSPSIERLEKLEKKYKKTFRQQLSIVHKRADSRERNA